MQEQLQSSVRARTRVRIPRFRLLVLPALLLTSLMPIPAGASAAGCPNEQRREESAVNPATGQPYSMALPDCRAYEQVTPAAGTNGASGLGVNVTAGDGETVLYSSGNAFGSSLGSPPANRYEAQRAVSGWTTTARNAPAADTSTPETLAQAESADATKLLFQFGGRTEPLEYFVGEPDGSLIATLPLPQAEFGFVGTSPDLATIVVQQQGGERSYQVVGAGGPSPELYRLGVAADGQPISDCGIFLGSSGVGGGDATASGIAGAEEGGETMANGATNFHAISADGDTVFFTAQGHSVGARCGAGTPAPAVNEVWAQIGATQTVGVSEPSSTDCLACKTGAGTARNAVFQGASGDGSKAFFTTEQELLSGQTGENIYEYDFDAQAGHKIVLVSGGSGEPKVQGVVGISEDGSHVYFVAQGVLTSAQNGVDQEAHAGADNMYVFERDAVYTGGRTQFVGELCSGPEDSGTVSDAACPPELNSKQGVSVVGGSVTPVNDTPLWVGRDNSFRLSATSNATLAFDSYAALTPDKTSTSQAVYLFNSATDDLLRASVGQNGYGDDGNSNTYGATIAGESHDVSELPGEDVSDDGSLSEDGGYVFFDSAEALAPGASEGVEHVYEYHEGQVYLISDGQDSGGATFQRATLSGSDVFFTSHDVLVGQDVNPGVGNIYDARIDGGFPAPVPAPAICSGEACQGPPAPAPSLQPPASKTFTGGANLTPPALIATPSKSAAQIRADKLAKALKACRKKSKKKKKRVTCEATAHKRYAAKTKERKTKARKLNAKTAGRGER